MSLYLVGVDGGILLVRARNEDQARLLAGGGPDDPTHYVTEGGPEELIVPPWLAPPSEDVREIEVSTMDDRAKGVRRYMNLDSREVRTEAS